MSLPEPELDLETEVAPSDLPSSIFEVGLSLHLGQLQWLYRYAYNSHCRTLIPHSSLCPMLLEFAAASPLFA